MKENKSTEIGRAQSDSTSLTLACRNGLKERESRREEEGELGETNNSGIQLLWTRQGQWLQSWHWLSTLVRLLLTQFNPSLRLIWLLGAIRSRILKLIKSQTGTETSTKKKKKRALWEPVWKVPASSVTPDNLWSQDTIHATGSAPIRARFKLLQSFVLSAAALQCCTYLLLNW